MQKRGYVSLPDRCICARSEARVACCIQPLGCQAQVIQRITKKSNHSFLRCDAKSTSLKSAMEDREGLNVKKKSIVIKAVTKAIPLRNVISAQSLCERVICKSRLRALPLSSMNPMALHHFGTPRRYSSVLSVHNILGIDVELRSRRSEDLGCLWKLPASGAE